MFRTLTPPRPPRRRVRQERVLGSGSYGEVASALDASSPSSARVAIKRIHNVFDLEMDTKRIVREVHILRRLKHENIVRLLDVITPSNVDGFNELYLVFEYVETDLHKLISTPQYLSIDHVRFLMYQLLCALKYMHSACVIHRDIKPANILINEDCGLKVCDFGLARVLRPKTEIPDALDPAAGVQASSSSSAATMASAGASPSGSKVQPTPPPKQVLQRQLTKHVVTRWYRPPELILLQEYTTFVDVWSVGCIFAELLSMQKESVPVYSDRLPLFPGRSCFPLSADNDRTYKDQLDQLNVIFDVIGACPMAPAARARGARALLTLVQARRWRRTSSTWARCSTTCAACPRRSPRTCSRCSAPPRPRPSTC
jgi:mitogen-activated protein kinase 1/3